ncbi:MAG: restriction endonuclease subunit S [Candidatus Gastranaerophilales bacterium]|nr:restriction endonuclease subunit S [Candidatus Gastranaerophilales bacterium]
MTEVIEKTENKKGYKKTKLGWIPEDWKIVKFCDAYRFLPTGSNSRADLNLYGEYHYIHYGDIHCKYKNILNCPKENIPNIDKNLVKNLPILKDKDLIFVDASEDYEGITKCTEIINVESYKIVSGLHTILLRPQIKMATGFGGYIASNPVVKKNIQKMASGWKVYGISKDNLSKIDFALPDILEQEKIAEILSAWDDGIEILEKIITQKEIQYKALMKSLLTGKKRLLKFSKISEYKRTKLGLIPVDWQVKPLKLLFDRRMQKYSGNSEHNIFTNSATKGVILQNEYFDRSIVTEENTSNYYVVGENDFMYNPRISNNAPAGPINRNKLGITGIASPLYTIFKAKHDTIIDFYEQYFSSNLWNNSMFMVANQGARHDRLNITSNDFMNMPLPYPSMKEQEEIANVLIENYKEIQLLNSKLEKLNEQKKGLMQKLLTGQIRVKV